MCQLSWTISVIEAEHAGEQRAGDEADAADDEREHDREPATSRNPGRRSASPNDIAKNAPAKPGDAGRQREHRELGLEHVDADGDRRGFAVAQRDESTAERAAPERDDTDCRTNRTPP